MSRTFWAVAVVAVLVLAGCAASDEEPLQPGPTDPAPPGPTDPPVEVRRAQEGDCARFAYSIQDAQGTVLDAGTAWAELGSGASGLVAVEAALVGLEEGGTVRLTVDLEEPSQPVEAGPVPGAQEGEPVRLPDAARDQCGAPAGALPGTYVVAALDNQTMVLEPERGALAAEAYGAQRTVGAELLELRNATGEAPAPVPLGEVVGHLDCVVLRFAAHDPATGALLREGTVLWEAGRNGSTGLGAEVEAVVEGRMEGEAFRLVSQDDAGGRAPEDGVRLMERNWGPNNLTQHWTTGFFFEVGNFWFDLENATQGDFVHVHHRYDGYYVSHNDTHVTVRFDPTPGMRYPLAPQLPIDVVVHVDEDAGTWTEVLEPRDVGGRFLVEPAPDYSCRTDFDLPPGRYGMEAPDETHLRMRLVEPHWGLEGPVAMHAVVDSILRFPDMDWMGGH